MDQSPCTGPVRAPLPPGLCPYVVLHPEASALPPGSRFGGHWVAAWRSRLPFVQLDRGRSWPVPRALSFSGDDDPANVRELLASAACFVAADEGWLETAAAAGTPTIWLADGRTDAVPLPRALHAFAGDRLQVLRSDTNFRRDLPLSLLNRALERCVPGIAGDDHSESSLCRERLRPFLQGRIADLGHGGHKIAPHAIGVDFFKFDASDLIGDVRDLWFFADQGFDTVYSSHCLEDLWHPHQALAEWTRVLRPGGHLVLFLPLRDFYPNVGTEGANPGHKDDYVPEDVEGLLRELGHVEVVHSARVEREHSFEVVARKKAGRSFFLLRDQRPRPVVSVLVVADPSHDRLRDATSVCATVAAAQAALAPVPHEVLVLDRTRSEGDQRAAVQDLAAREHRVHVLTDRRPLPLGARYELLRRAARGEHLLVLAPGTLPAPDCGARLLAALAGAPAVRATCVDPLGRPLPDAAAPGACLLLHASAWPTSALEQTSFTSPLLWHAVAERLQAAPVAEALAVTAGSHFAPLTARAGARQQFDRALLQASVDPFAAPPPSRILVAMLRTLGDCVLATPVLDALQRRHPGALIDVVTEQAYAWVFASHPAVASVIAVPGLPESSMFWAEDRAVAAALAERDYDRLVWLTDRHEHVSYHHSGLTLADFYAEQAGVPEVLGESPRVRLAPEPVARCSALRAQHGLQGKYAVLHTRGGWPEKSLPDALAVAIAECLHSHGLTPVVVGGPGERVAHRRAVNLAGLLSQAESAALIAHSTLFVGPDSGPLHLASAFGIRSLALYAGSHLRVAPPRAPGSCSIQATTCCPVPCGLTPCPERHCGNAGLREELVLPRLEALLAGQEGGEWWGSEPVVCASSADGAVLLGRERQATGTLLAGSVPCRNGNGIVTAPPVPVTALQVRFDQQALAAHVKSVRATVPEAGQVSVREPGTLLESLRTGLTPADAVDLLRVLAWQCAVSGQYQAALQAFAAAISHCGAMVRGTRGRVRPAYLHRAEELLHEAVAMAMTEPAGSAVRLRLFELFTSEVGKAPPLSAALLAVAVADHEIADAAVRRRFRELLEPCRHETPECHAEALRRVALLRKVGDLAASVELASRHLSALPPWAEAEIAACRFLRGTSLAADPARTAEALADMRAAALLLDAGDRESALRIALLLERHLAVAAAR